MLEEYGKIDNEQEEELIVCVRNMKVRKERVKSSSSNAELPNDRKIELPEPKLTSVHDVDLGTDASDHMIGLSSPYQGILIV